MLSDKVEAGAGGSPGGGAGQIAPNLGCVSGARVASQPYLLPAHGLAEGSG